jgi:hypothetical protein
MFVAIALTVIGLVWFGLAQRRPDRPYTVLPPGAPEAAGAAEATPDEATTGETLANEATAEEPPMDENTVDDITADDRGKGAADPSSGDHGAVDDAGVTTTRSED